MVVFPSPLVFRAHRERWIFRCGWLAGENLQFDRPVLIDGIWIEWMLAGVEHDERVDFETEFDGIAGFGVFRNESQAAFFIGDDLAEKVEVGD